MRMTGFETDNDPARPECAVGQAALQRLLDGEAAWDSPEAAAHRNACTACREELALAGALTQAQSIVIPAGFTDRVLNSAVSARRRAMLMRWAGVGFALAASVVIAVVVVRAPDSKQEIRSIARAPSPVERPAPKVDPPKPLGDSMSEARDAIVSLTKRTAAQTRDQSAMLVPMPKVPEPPAPAADLDPLADARTGAEQSVEPIRSSARRALNFFARAADPPQSPKRKK